MADRREAEARARHRRQEALVKRRVKVVLDQRQEDPDEEQFDYNAEADRLFTEAMNAKRRYEAALENADDIAVFELDEEIREVLPGIARSLAAAKKRKIVEERKQEKQRRQGEAKKQEVVDANRRVQMQNSPQDESESEEEDLQEVDFGQITPEEIRQILLNLGVNMNALDGAKVENDVVRNEAVDDEEDDMGLVNDEQEANNGGIGVDTLGKPNNLQATDQDLIATEGPQKRASKPSGNEPAAKRQVPAEGLTYSRWAVYGVTCADAKHPTFDEVNICLAMHGIIANADGIKLNNARLNCITLKPSKFVITFDVVKNCNVDMMIREHVESTDYTRITMLTNVRNFGPDVQNYCWVSKIPTGFQLATSALYIMTARALISKGQAVLVSPISLLAGKVGSENLDAVTLEMLCSPDYKNVLEEAKEFLSTEARKKLRFMTKDWCSNDFWKNT